MLARRFGWSCSAQVPAVYKIWGGSGHGYRQVYHLMSARLPRVGLSEVVNTLPGTHKPGLCEPLHAHVRNLDNGWRRSKSQESR